MDNLPVVVDIQLVAVDNLLEEVDNHRIDQEVAEEGSCFLLEVDIRNLVVPCLIALSLKPWT